jgi:hypothetical protein
MNSAAMWCLFVVSFIVVLVLPIVSALAVPAAVAVSSAPVSVASRLVESAYVGIGEQVGRTLVLLSVAILGEREGFLAALVHLDNLFCAQ